MEYLLKSNWSKNMRETIVDSVNDAVKGLSGEVNIDIQINENG